VPLPCAAGRCNGRSTKASTSLESWNRANAIIFYGKSGDLATNRRDEQEMSVLCLRILQAAMVYVNTLMLQDILADRSSGRTCLPRRTDAV
jgi:TnpA family transposase